MACACKQRAAQAALLLQQQNAARLAAQSAEISAQETPLFDYSEFTAEEWAQAGGVIVASALLCGMLGQSFGHPVVGVVVGVALGAAAAQAVQHGDDLHGWSTWR